jgi:hypothetical protein
VNVAVDDLFRWCGAKSRNVRTRWDKDAFHRWPDEGLCHPQPQQETEPDTLHDKSRFWSVVHGFDTRVLILLELAN